jgi:hypothetical protein
LNQNWVPPSLPSPPPQPHPPLSPINSSLEIILYRWIENLGHDSNWLLVEYMANGHKPAAILLPILHIAPCTTAIP